jgi:hypothetical protein
MENKSYPGEYDHHTGYRKRESTLLFDGQKREYIDKGNDHFIHKLPVSSQFNDTEKKDKKDTYPQQTEVVQIPSPD